MILAGSYDCLRSGASIGAETSFRKQAGEAQEG